MTTQKYCYEKRRRSSESQILHYQKYRDLAILQGKSVLVYSHYSSADKLTILVNLNYLIKKHNWRTNWKKNTSWNSEDICGNHHILKCSGNLGHIVVKTSFIPEPVWKGRGRGCKKKKEIKTQVKWEIHIPTVEMYISANRNREGAFYIILTLTNMSYTWEIASFMDELASEEVWQLSVNLVHWRSDKISSEQETMIFDIRFLLDKLLLAMPQIARRLLEIRSTDIFLHSRCPLSDVLSVWTPISLISLHIMLLGSQWVFSYQTEEIIYGYSRNNMTQQDEKLRVIPPVTLQMYLFLFIKLNHQ